MNRLPCPWGVSPVPAWGQVTDFTTSRTQPREESCGDFRMNRMDQSKVTALASCRFNGKTNRD